MTKNQRIIRRKPYIKPSNGTNHVKSIDNSNEYNADASREVQGSVHHKVISTTENAKNSTKPIKIQCSKRLKDNNKNASGKKEIELRRSTRVKKPVERYSALLVPLVTDEDRAKSEQEVLETTYGYFRNGQFYGREEPWIP